MSHLCKDMVKIAAQHRKLGPRELVDLRPAILRTGVGAARAQHVLAKKIREEAETTTTKSAARAV